jgi:hypothetical protein
MGIWNLNNALMGTLWRQKNGAKNQSVFKIRDCINEVNNINGANTAILHAKYEWFDSFQYMGTLVFH